MANDKSPIGINLCKLIDPQGSHISDREGYIFDPILLESDLYKLVNYFFEEYREDQDEFNPCESNLTKSIVP